MGDQAAGEPGGHAAGPATGPAAGAGPRSGPHQVLLALYALFVLAAGARSIVQLATDAGRAPVAYVLSLLAALTYAAGWVAIRRASAGKDGFARVMLWVDWNRLSRHSHSIMSTCWLNLMGSTRASNR